MKNVVGIGNAGGFVEPLQASSIGTICMAAQNLTELLLDGDMVIRDCEKSLFNQRVAQQWDDIRRFLALHFKINNRIDTPFWREAVNKTDLAGCEPIVDYYQQCGPTPIWENSFIHKTDPFGAEGYLSLLVGAQVPYNRTYVPTERDRQIWQTIRQHISRAADGGFSTADVLAGMRSGQWMFSPHAQMS